MEPVDIHAAIHNLSKLLHSTFPKKIRIIIGLEADNPRVMLNHTQFFQALMNLSMTAQHAMTGLSFEYRPDPVFTIRTKEYRGDLVRRLFQKADQPRYVCIELSDNGHGMDQTTKFRLFDSSTPAFASETHYSNINLENVRKMINKAEGFVDVESVLGHGTSVRLFLPLIDTQPIEERRSNDGIAVQSTDHETILVAEDEEGIAIPLITQFESKGYRVVFAKDGIEALQLYSKKQSEIKVAFLDLEMPKLDGEKVFAAIRDLNPRQKVIMASGYVMHDKQQELMSYGLSEFIQKPYMPDEVIRAVRKAIDT
jgi:two-component system, cell cycle sensor histidine kinase and response regulator CckA